MKVQGTLTQQASDYQSPNSEVAFVRCPRNSSRCHVLEDSRPPSVYGYGGADEPVRRSESQQAYMFFIEDVNV